MNLLVHQYIAALYSCDYQAKHIMAPRNEGFYSVLCLCCSCVPLITH